MGKPFQNCLLRYNPPNDFAVDELPAEVGVCHAPFQIGAIMELDSLGKSSDGLADVRGDGNRRLRLSGSRHTTPHKPATGIVPALENAIIVMQTINDKGAAGASLAQLIAELEISKSHCHALLKTLHYFGWLEFSPVSKLYHVSAGILPSISSVFSSTILDFLRDSLASFSQEQNLPTILTQPQTDGTFIIVGKFHGTQSAELSLPIGFRYPSDAPAQSRALMAWCSRHDIEAWLRKLDMHRYTDNTLLSFEERRAELEETRARGYARSDGELTEGLLMLSVPVFARNGEVAYILNCMERTSSLSPRERQIASAMMDLAKVAEERISAFV